MFLHHKLYHSNCFLYLRHLSSFPFFASTMISIFFRAPITLPFIEASSIFFLHYWRCDRFPQLFVVCWRLHVWPWWSLHGQVWFEHFATKRPVLTKMSLSSDDHFSLHDSNIWICDLTFSFSEPGAHLKREGLAASRFLISFYQTAETNKKLTKFKLHFFFPLWQTDDRLRIKLVLWQSR